MTPSYSTPTRVRSSLGSRAGLGAEILALGGTRVVIVGDGGLHRAGMLAQFEAAIDDTPGVRLATVLPVEVDPTTAAADAAAQTAIEHGADLVVGVGGGSALSLAKAVALLLTNPGPIAQYVGVGRASVRPAPFIAIPTTAGSGSEVSNAFVLYDPASEHSLGMRGDGYEPDVALLDGELLVGLPAAPFIDAAADALSHGFEALWARGASRFTDTVSLEAIRLIRTLLPVAVRDREPAALQTLLEASTLANFGCGNAGLGLVHALSSASSIRVPHGRQNAILLPVVADYNRSVVAPEVAAEIDLLPELYAAAGIPARFESDELPADAANAMVAAALTSPFLANNRRPATETDLLALAEAAVASTHVSADRSQP